MSIALAVSTPYAGQEFNKIQLGRIEPLRPLRELIDDPRTEKGIAEDAKFLIRDVGPEDLHFDRHFALCYVNDFFASVNPVFREVENRVASEDMLCPQFAAPYLLKAVTENSSMIRGESILVVSQRIEFEKHPHMMRITRRNRTSPWSVAIYRIENPLMKMMRDCPIIVAMPSSP